MLWFFIIFHKNISPLTFKDTSMNIYIIGAGAIGKALAVCLSRNGKTVRLIRGSVDHGKQYTEK